MNFEEVLFRAQMGDQEAILQILEMLLASGDISHLLSGENDQSQSDRNNQCISFSFL